MSELPITSESVKPFNAEVERRMSLVFAEVFCITTEVVKAHFDAPLYEYTAVDSQKVVELIILIEKEFEIIISGNDQDEFSGQSTARSCCDYVLRHRN